MWCVALHAGLWCYMPRVHTLLDVPIKCCFVLSALKCQVLVTSSVESCMVDFLGASEYILTISLLLLCQGFKSAFISPTFTVIEYAGYL